MAVPLLSLFSLMLLESAIVYLYPGIYRALFGLLAGCSRTVAAVGALPCMAVGMAAASVVRRAESPEWEYLGWLGVLLATATGLTLLVAACSGDELRQRLVKQVAAIEPAQMKSYAVVGLLLNTAVIAAIVTLADF